MKENINLFVTCIIDTLYPEIGKSVVQVLNKAGVEVAFPKAQTCCGQPAYNAGLWELARPIAMHTIEVLESVDGPVVIPSGSCTAMIRHGYLELFADDPQWLSRATAIAERTYEFTEYLVDQLNVIDFGASFEGKVAYHSSCHLLRDLGVDKQPRLLLNAVMGIEFGELPHSDECCGFGGVFSVEHPEISLAMLERKIDNIDQSGARTIVSCDAGCLTNINGGLHRKNKQQRVLHIAEILAGNTPQPTNQ